MEKAIEGIKRRVSKLLMEDRWVGLNNRLQIHNARLPLTPHPTHTRTPSNSLLLHSSLLNIDPSTKTYTRRTLSDIIHPYNPTSSTPNFNYVAFSSVNTSVPVHFYLSSTSHSVFCFIDHCIADGLTMYNEVVAPIIDNPRFKLAKRPVYAPVLTEMHQLYVVGRMAHLYGRALLMREQPLERLSKEQQWAAFHKIKLGQVKEVKNR
jgi:hypothetical protein